MVLGPNFSFLPILFLPAHTTSSSGTSDSTAVSREGATDISHLGIHRGSSQGQPYIRPKVLLVCRNMSLCYEFCTHPSLLVLNMGQCINLKLHSEMPATTMISNEICTREFDRLDGVQAMAMAWDGCQPWGEHSSVSTNAINTHESTWMPTTQYPFMNLA